MTFIYQRRGSSNIHSRDGEHCKTISSILDGSNVHMLYVFRSSYSEGIVVCFHVCLISEQTLLCQVCDARTLTLVLFVGVSVWAGKAIGGSFCCINCILFQFFQMTWCLNSRSTTHPSLQFVDVCYRFKSTFNWLNLLECVQSKDLMLASVDFQVLFVESH